MSIPQHPPITLHSGRAFAAYVARYLVVAMTFLALSLGIGALGYHSMVGLGWVDAVLNASMILTGMGPVDQMPNDEAKIFASAYAIFSGAAYPAVTAIILYPFLTRMMKILHLQALNTPAQNDQADYD